MVQNNCQKIAVFGEWNTTNLGDRAILEGVIDFFRDTGWAIETYGLGSLTPIYHPSILKNDQTKLGKYQFYSDANTPLISNSNLTNWVHHPFQKYWKRFIRAFRQQIRIRLLMPQLSQAQAILVGGGALLSDWNLHFPQSLAEISWAAKQLHLPVFCLGCSAEEEWSPQGRKIIQDFVQSCQFVATRDQKTANRLSDLLSTRVGVFGDFALRIHPTKSYLVDYKQISHCKQTLAVNVMKLSEHRKNLQQSYEDQLVNLVNAYLNQENIDSNVTIFTTGSTEDIKPAQQVFTRINTTRKLLITPTNLEDLYEVFRSSHLVLASRLHSAILAISEGLPVVGVAPGSKIQQFFEPINLKEFSVDILQPQAVSQIISLLNGYHLYQQKELIDLFEIERNRKQVKALLTR
ncbi:polysaccharide pyruvyl transferase family protein [Pantanalinema rosaneae CENA516]|uniref:polysaccharide pyruvyl transferase family protein n=1 Tax=Pantanalinema rosaneae TaxID=1620701 RepID=UPI003D6E6DE6